MTLEPIWPLDRTDYLLICELHPIRYVSCAALVARLGDLDDEEVSNEPPVTKQTSGKPVELTDWYIVSRRVGREWRSLRQVASSLGLLAPSELASVAKALSRGVSKGLLERRQIELSSASWPRPRKRYFYRMQRRSSERGGQS